MRQTTQRKGNKNIMRQRQRRTGREEKREREKGKKDRYIDQESLRVREKEIDRERK